MEIFDLDKTKTTKYVSYTYLSDGNKKIIHFYSWGIGLRTRDSLNSLYVIFLKQSLHFIIRIGLFTSWASKVFTNSERGLIQIMQSIQVTIQTNASNIMCIPITRVWRMDNINPDKIYGHKKLFFSINKTTQAEKTQEWGWRASTKTYCGIGLKRIWDIPWSIAITHITYESLGYCKAFQSPPKMNPSVHPPT